MDKQEDYLFKTTPIFNDLFNDTFDLGSHQNNPQKNLTFLPEERNRAVDDGTVTYTFNNEYFRSDDFTKIHNGKHILFAGCSETEGAGGNIEEVWSKILYEKINEKVQCSGFFNLARSGWGYHRIIQNCSVYFKKYGYPDNLFILLPNVDRNFYYYERHNVWSYLTSVPLYYDDVVRHLKEKAETKNYDKTSTAEQYLQKFASFLYTWKMFCDFCDSKNIKLIFSTWDQLDRKNYQSINLFKNYLNLNNDDIDDFINKYYQKNIPHSRDIEKRDKHNGTVIHHYWAEMFYQRYINEG